MDKLIIIGASGHGKVVAEIARLCGYKEIIFLDNDSSIHSCSGYPVLGADNLVSQLSGDVFVAVGNAEIRKRLMEREHGRRFPALIHPSAVVSNSVEIGEGTVVMAGAVINPEAKIGRGCIINTGSSVDHDCVVSDYVHVSVGAHLSGTVKVGERTWVGAGVTINNNISICEGCMIGAGAVVVRDITESGTYIGVPAKKRK